MRGLGLRQLSISAVVAALLGALLLLPSITGLTAGVGDQRLVLALNGFTVVLILLLGFLLVRNFVMLVGERRRGILGSQLELKFAAAFVLVVLVTAASLFAVSAFFIGQSIDRRFDLGIDGALHAEGEAASPRDPARATSELLLGARTAEHLRSAYLLELSLAFVAILMLAIWMGFRLARGVTGAIRELAEGTAEVAGGNLGVVVERTSEDELGFLVQSFNRMTHDLQIARDREKRTRSELDHRRRYMETVVGTIGAGVLSLSADGRVLTLNPSARRALGIAAEADVVGQKLDGVASAGDLIGTLRQLGDKLLPGVRERVRRQTQVPVGDEVATLLVTAELLYDDAGESSGTLVVLDDMTQLVKVQRMEAWREVARRIAHEIKNPLTPIQLSAQRIRRRFRGRLAGDDEAVAVLDECVESIQSHVAGLEVLVHEFSNFARLPAARPRPDDLNQLVADAVASYQGTDGVSFETELACDLPPVEIDREQMRRALANLIDNAIAAVRAGDPATGGGHVRLRTLADAGGGRVRLEVIDDGAGVPAGDRRRIFDPYYSTKPSGTGLGLAIVSRIVADHRGYVRVHDAAPRGARFVVELPA